MREPVKKNIVVVGGGIAGLYTAYKIKEKRSDLSVSLYESQNTFGGRIESIELINGHKREVGGVRVEPELSPLVNHLFNDLKIETEAWTHTVCESNTLDFTKLTTKEKTHINKHIKKGIPWALLDYFLTVFLKGASYKNRKTLFNNLKDRKINGKYLYEYGVWNIFSMHMSYEAVNFIKEKGSFYNMRTHNQNALDWIVFLYQWHSVTRSYIPKEKSMADVTALLVRKLNQMGVELYRDHKMTSIERKGGYENIKFENGLEVTANNIILALPQKPLLKMCKNSFPKAIETCIKSVIPIPIIMIHCIADNPPWDNSTKAFSGEGACVRTAHFSLNKNGTGNAFLYIDQPWHQFWKGLFDLETSANGCFVNDNQHLKQEIINTLNNIFHRHCKLIAWCVKDWGQTEIGAAVHLWKKGCVSQKVISNLNSFRIHDQSATEFHICGEAYSTLQGFIQGALSSAQGVVDKILESQSSET